MKNNKDYCTVVIGLFLLVAGLALIKIVEEPQGIMCSLPYVCIGIGCGVFGGSMGNIIGKKALKKHPELAQQKEIEVNDERNVMIANMSKAKAYDMMFFVFGALMIAFALMGVSIELILLLIVAYLWVVGYGIYYRVKYEKEI